MRKEPGRDGCHVRLVLTKDHPSDYQDVHVGNQPSSAKERRTTHALTLLRKGRSSMDEVV
jgi:hypothetical protein